MRTRNWPSTRLAWESTAKQRTVVRLCVNVEPEGGLQVTGRSPSTASTAVADHVTTGLSVVMSSGSVSTGATVSVTKTRNPAVVVPSAFVAEHDTEVTPIGNCEPDAGVQVMSSGSPFGLIADAKYVTTAPSRFSASATTPSGMLMSGGPPVGRSFTVNVTVLDVRTPAPSIERT